MRAGSLDRTISIEHADRSFDRAGASVETWVPLAILRARLMDNAMADHQGDSGAETDTVLTFQTYYMPGLTLDERLVFEGDAFEIRKVIEIGRRRGMQITARRFGQ